MMKKDKPRFDDRGATGTAEPTESSTPAEKSNPPAPAASSLSDQEIADLRSQAAKGQEHWEQLVRTAADFDNYKKRAMRERAEAVKFANEALLQKLIPVLDNFDMATAVATSAGSTIESLQTGVNMILSQFRQALTDAGLEEIDATDKVFDPNFHEAVSQQETADVPEGQVVQQLRKGYKLRERLLRPATVIVASGPKPPQP